MTETTARTAELRWSAYLLLIAVAAGGMLGRILAVNSVDALLLERRLQREGGQNQQLQRPFLSANDRSRWATVRALVEQGTYSIDDIVAERGWDTIDMVKHVGRDGKDHLYSSKPPLFATLLAGPYWIIHRLTGMTLAEAPYEIGRFMLVFVNLLPMLLYFVLLALLAERLGATDWGRLFMMAAATLGTFLTTFVTSINNHTAAAVCAAIALSAAVRIWYDGERRRRYFVLAGTFAALAATNELPALSLLTLLGAGLMIKAPRETLWGYLPPTLIVAAAALGTNYAAHDSFRPPYLHRSATDPADNWYDYTYERDGRERSSYWRNPVGIDQGEAAVAMYAVHALVGHHGIFSLSPIWLLSVAGMWMSWRQSRYRELAGFVAILSLVCLAFYLSRPQMDRNYGGMTSGLRWMFWFAPLWLVTMLPAVDRLSMSRFGRGFALLLLAWSAMSVSYPTWNPWTQPWLWNWLNYLGWN